MDLRAPNYTQTPNEFFDDMAKTLKEGELRVLLVIMRQTFGWRKRWDRISLSQLMEKTGMCRDAVSNSLKSLVLNKIVIKHKEGNPGQEKCWYTLAVDEPEKEPEFNDEFNESPTDSNSFYQSSKTTPPSSLKRPTKETTTKEKKPPSVPCVDVGPQILEEKSYRSVIKEKHVDNVYLSKEEHQKLLEDHGNEKVDFYILALDHYLENQSPKNASKYKSHYKTINVWIKRDKNDKKPNIKDKKYNKIPQKTEDNIPAWLLQTQ